MKKNYFSNPMDNFFKKDMSYREKGKAIIFKQVIESN